MSRRSVLPSIVLLAAVLLGAGCGGESSKGADDPGAARAADAPATQAELDDVMDGYRSDIEVLDDAYPEMDDDLQTVIDAFAAALEEEDGVERVEQVEDWSIDDPLPCGETDAPDRAVIAHGSDDDFFIGRASRGWIVGFAETADDDIGTVVARCVDGDSSELHLVGTPEPGEGEYRVAAASLEESTEDLRATLKDRVDDGKQADDIELEQGWEDDDPIDCVTGDEFRPVKSTDGSDTTVLGIVGSDVVAIVTADREGTLAELLASCEDGTARGFRQIARPLDEALEDAE